MGLCQKCCESYMAEQKELFVNLKIIRPNFNPLWQHCHHEEEKDRRKLYLIPNRSGFYWFLWWDKTWMKEPELLLGWFHPIHGVEFWSDEPEADIEKMKRCVVGMGRIEKPMKKEFGCDCNYLDQYNYDIETEGN